MTEQTAAAAAMPVVVRSLLRTTLPAATVPLLLFTLVFGGWLWAFRSGQDGLRDVLGWTLLAAALLVFVGVAVGGACLLFNIWRGLQVTDPETSLPQRRSLIKHAGFHATLLVLNLPVVFLLGTVVVGLTDRSFVVIDNRSTANIADLILSDEAGDHPLGGVRPQSTETLRIKPVSEFTLSGIIGEDAVDLGHFELDGTGRVEATVRVGQDRGVTVVGGRQRQVGGDEPNDPIDSN